MRIRAQSTRTGSQAKRAVAQPKRAGEQTRRAGPLAPSCTRHRMRAPTRAKRPRLLRHARDVALEACSLAGEARFCAARASAIAIGGGQRANVASRHVTKAAPCAFEASRRASEGSRSSAQAVASVSVARRPLWRTGSYTREAARRYFRPWSATPTTTEGMIMWGAARRAAPPRRFASSLRRIAFGERRASARCRERETAPFSPAFAAAKAFAEGDGGEARIRRMTSEGCEGAQPHFTIPSVVGPSGPDEGRR
jgi:hypothetical protein